MPQTLEHAAILKALAIATGVVAVTKSDLADPARALEQSRQLLGAVEAIPVSARTGAGIEQLRAALERAAHASRSRAELPGPTRLHVDRVFTIKGAGTVVTGTLWSGTITRGDRLKLLPAGTPARVRGVQVHEAELSEAQAGQRVAVNLTVGRDQAARGDVLTDADAELASTYLIDAALEFGDTNPEPEHGDRVQVHHGTRETPARLAWLGGRFWQLRLEQPLVPAAGDRLVIRRVGPPDTLGGGAVLDPHPRKHGPGRETLVRLHRLARGEGERDETTARPDPERPRHQPPPLTPSALALEESLRAARFEPPLNSELDANDLAAVRAAGRAVRVSEDLDYHPEVLSEVTERAIRLAERNGGSLTLGQLRDELGTSRKFAHALLTHLDSERVTIRRGDEHVLRRSQTAR
jgi:selenocysteine-specific elongation factor